MSTNNDRWKLLWGVRRSQRYHARRMGFFDRWHKLTAVAGVLGGSAVFVAMAHHVPGWLAGLGAGLVVLLSSIDLVVGTSEMARRHNDLRRRFCLLEAAIEAKPEPRPADIARWKEERLAIEADEPPVYVALDLLCENELRRATYPPEKADLINVPWYKARAAHWVRWEGS